MTSHENESGFSELEPRLRTLAQAAPREAPASVEAALVAEFRRRRRARRLRVAGYRWLAAAAAVALVAAGLTAWRRNTSPVQAPIPVRAPIAAAPARPAPLPLAQGAGTQVAAARAARRAPKAVRRVVRAVPKRRAVTEPEIATGFIPVGYGPAPLEQASVVRVRLPRSALLSFGLPMNVERMSEPVQADVLLGQDGVARAIRFVR